MKNKTATILIAIVTFLLAITTISAQTSETDLIASSKDASVSVSPKTDKTLPSTDYNKNEIYGGYSYQRAYSRSYSGFEASYTRNFKRYLGLKGDFSYTYTNGPESSDPDTILKESIYNFTGGIQFKDNSTGKRFKPFAHALAGVVYTTGEDFYGGVVLDGGSSKRFLMTFGGGIDIKINKRFDVRVIQFDYNVSHSEGYSFNGYRIGAGIVFH